MDQKFASSITPLVLDTAPLGIVVFDSNNTIMFLNSTLRKILNIEEQSVDGSKLTSLPIAFGNAISEAQAIIDLPAEYGTPPRTLKSWCQPLSLDNDTFTVCYCLDMTEVHAVYKERDRLAAELAQFTTRDTITGLPNRQALFQGLEPLVSRSRRYSNPLSVIRLQVGHYQKLDSDFGSGSSDTVLVQISQLLKDQMRWADLIGRLNKDEFLLILPETPGDAAKALANKLSLKISKLEIPSANGNTFTIMPFFGVASWKKGDDSKLLLNTAAKDMTTTDKGAAA